MRKEIPQVCVLQFNSSLILVDFLNCLWLDGLGRREVLTKGYSHLDGFQTSGNYCNCDGDDCDVVAEDDDDDEDDRDNVDDDDDDGDAPDNRLLFKNGGKATGMCLQFLIFSRVWFTSFPKKRTNELIINQLWKCI